ncbi:MAG: nucleotidyl transferase AbiEii/AbiGii toxin family protein, partial [Planctomycetes bacterium]|nr:nucleotidyl transferase AbiEii/AbiGii toxin family protein [Planctomycetota bacterium]
ARDLFDSEQLLRIPNLDARRLRIAFVVYGAMNRKDWRTVSIGEVDLNAEEFAVQLIPMLRRNPAQERQNTIDYCERLVKNCRASLSTVLPLSDEELKFLELILDRGEVIPSLLTDDVELQQRILRQPLLEWKAQHVRQHKGRK